MKTRILTRLVAMLTALLLTCGCALAQEIPAELLNAVQAMGFESVEDAMKQLGVTSMDQLLALYQQMVLTGTLPSLDARAQDEPAAEIEVVADAEAVADAGERSFDGKVLATMEMAASAEEIRIFFQQVLGIPIADFLCFPTINEALLALQAGKVDTLLSMDASATYIAAQNPAFYTYMDPRLQGLADVSLSMVVLRTNEALCAELNAALATLKENGVLDGLIGLMFSSALVDAPPYEAAGEPLKVGVTGDIPPVDYVNENGEPMGFNVNLMSQIGAILGRPVEFVPTNKGSILMALATGAIDVVFWQEQSISEGMADKIGDLSDQVMITDPYLTLTVTAIEMK